jgi:hypothetical protein
MSRFAQHTRISLFFPFFFSAAGHCISLGSHIHGAKDFLPELDAAGGIDASSEYPGSESGLLCYSDFGVA